MSKIAYRPEIDGLRAISVLSVILYHAGVSPFYGGFIGVDVFFVISGYLITSILLMELETNTFSLSSLYQRRIKRILPASTFVILVISALSYKILFPNEFKEYSESLIYIATMLANYFFYKTSGYFDIASELKPMLHFWSLAVEEQFYLFFPIFFFDKKTPLPSAYSLIPVLGTILVITYSDASTFLGKILSYKLFTTIGLLSYSAYLWEKVLKDEKIFK